MYWSGGNRERGGDDGGGRFVDVVVFRRTTTVTPYFTPFSVIKSKFHGYLYTGRHDR